MLAEKPATEALAAGVGEIVRYPRPVAPPAHSRRWLVLAMLSALLVAIVGWMQTQSAFQRLWLPLASRALGGEWSAEAGRLGFGGSIEADGLHFDLPELVTADIAYLRVQLRPWASLRRGTAVIERLELRGGNIEVHEREPVAAGAEESLSSAEESSPFRWPEIAEARIDELRVHTQAGEFSVALGPLTIRVDDLLVPERGTLSFEIPVEQVVSGDALRGRLTGSLEFAGAVAATDGYPFEGKLELEIEPKRRGRMVLALGGRGHSVPAGERVQLDELEFRVSEDGARLLELLGSGQLLPHPLLDMHLILGRAGRVARLLGAPVLAARLEGDVQIEGSYNELVILPSLRIDELRVHADAATTFSEPLQLGGRMIWKRTKRTLSLAPLELGGRAPEGLGMVSLEGDLQLGIGADVAITAKAFDLLPWLRLASGGEGVPEARAPIDGSLRVRQVGEETSIEAELQLSVVPAPDAAPGPQLGLALLATSKASSRLEGHVSLDGPGVEGTVGHARIEWERDRIAEHLQTRVRADITALDLTSLAPIWENALGERFVAEADRALKTPVSAASAETPADLVDLDVAIGALQFGGLIARGGRLRAQLGGDRWEVRVEDLGLADGLVDLEAHGGPHGGGRRIGWDLEIVGVDVEALLAAVSPDGERRMSGRLTFRSRAEGVAAPGEELLTAPNGRVSFDLSEGQASGLPLQQLLAQAAEIAEFAVIDYDEFEGDFVIENGRVLVDELTLRGAAVHLVATGEIGARDIDLVINPRLGPSLQAMVPIDMLGGVLGAANQFLALPIVVVVRGPLPGFEIELQPAAPSVLQGSFSGLVELLTPEEGDLAAPPPAGS